MPTKTEKTQHAPHCAANTHDYQWEGTRNPLDAQQYVCNDCGRPIDYQHHHSKLPPSEFNACETIDAAMFSGDLFLDQFARAALRDYMARWERGMIEHQAVEVEVEIETSNALSEIFTAIDQTTAGADILTNAETGSFTEALKKPRTRLEKLRAILAEDPELGSVSDADEFRQELARLEADENWRNAGQAVVNVEPAPEGLTPLGEKFFGVETPPEDPEAVKAREQLAAYRKTFPPRTPGCNHLQGENVCGICVPDKPTRLSIRSELYRLIARAQDTEPVHSQGAQGGYKGAQEPSPEIRTAVHLAYGADAKARQEMRQDRVKAVHVPGFDSNASTRREDD